MVVATSATLKVSVCFMRVQVVFLNGLSPACFILVLFKKTLQFLQQYMWKYVHPVSSAGIRTHDI